MDKIPNFDTFGAVFPHFCPEKRDIWMGADEERTGGDLRSAPSAKFHVYRVSVIFGPLSKQYRHGCVARRPADNIKQKNKKYHTFS